MNKTALAILALEDGNVFYGTPIGHIGSTVGEVVFNTAMTGYQEVLTDPSYAQQIITFTHPAIGNTGINNEDTESNAVQVAGTVIRNLTKTNHHWRSVTSLDDYLKEHEIVGIADIDTRGLTHILRDQGAQRGCIVSGIEWNDALLGNNHHPVVQKAITQARQCPSLNGMDLAKEVSTTWLYQWEDDISSPWLTESLAEHRPGKPYHVVVYDYGVKHNILRLLVSHGCKPTVVPAQIPVSEVLTLKPDGVLLSNGPGDPLACDYAIKAIRELLDRSIPLFGICLGCQLLALACGAKTYKMRFGQHGINHPVKSKEADKSAVIVSQNHGFAIDENTLPSELVPSHHALFDGTLQGILHTTKPAMGFQGHPEGSPGPHDLHGLFKQFIELMREKK